MPYSRRHLLFTAALAALPLAGHAQAPAACTTPSLGALSQRMGKAWLCTSDAGLSAAAREVLDALVEVATIAACIDGKCGFECALGFADCNNVLADGCETDVTSDTAHCGAWLMSPAGSARCQRDADLRYWRHRTDLPVPASGSG